MIPEVAKETSIATKYFVEILRSQQLHEKIPDELKNEFVKKIRVASGCTTHDVLYLTEYGVYFVLMKSRSKEAIKYQMKIADILKSIRLKGYAVSENITNDQVAKLVQDAKNKAKLIEAQGNVVRVNDRFISSLKELIRIYEEEKSKVAEIVAEDLFNKQY